MAKIPIPDDWNGTDFACYQVTVPDSTLWRAIFRGLVGSLTRGFFWDERTGVVTAAQLLGWDIYDSMTGCDGDGNGDGGVPSAEIVERIITLMCGEEDEEMGCGIDPCWFKIEGGIFYVRDHCGDWVAIGSLYSPAELTPTPPASGAAEFSACGKVDSLMSVIVAIAQAACVTPSEGAIRAAAAGYTLSRAGIYALIATAQASLLSVSYATMFASDRIQLAKCKAVAGVADTETMTQDERVWLVSSIRSAMYETLDSGQAQAAFDVYDAAVDALGDNDALLAGSVGSTNLTADCSCPNGVISVGQEFATINGWYIGNPISAGDLTDATETTQVVHDTFVIEQDLFGLVLTWNYIGGQIVKPMSPSAGGSLPLGSYDQQLWGDTSGHFENDPPGAVYIFQDDSLVVTELAAKHGFTNVVQSTAGTWSNNPAVPASGHNLSDAYTYAWEIRRTAVAGDFGPLTIHTVYPIYNINSPSHA